MIRVRQEMEHSDQQKQQKENKKAECYRQEEEMEDTRRTK
jgi:hypothetical protein